MRERKLLCAQCADILSISYRLAEVSRPKKGACFFCGKKRPTKECVIEKRENKK